MPKGYPNINSSFDGYHLPSGQFYPGRYIDYVNKTLFGETRVAEKTPQSVYKSVLGKSDLRDLYVGTVNKANGEFELKGSTEDSSLQTKIRGDYIPGSEFEAGSAIRVDNKKSGWQWETGYYDDYYTDEVGIKLQADSNGKRIIIKDEPVNYSKTIEYEDWNWGFLGADDPKTIDNPLNADLDFSNIIIVTHRLAYYGGGPIDTYAIIYDGYGNYIPIILHRFRREGIVNLSNSNLFLKQKAVNCDLHIGGRQMGPLGKQQRNTRTVPDYNFFDGSFNGSAGVWEPVISFQMKQAFKNTYLLSGRFAIAEPDFAGYAAIFVDPTLTNDNFGAATDVPAAEDATEWDKSADSMDITDIWAMSGLLRFTSGNGNQAGGTSIELISKQISEFDTVTLAVKPDADVANGSLHGILENEQGW